ncbi:MAG: hydroxyisourate hydrolase [Acidobacteria bacterium]|nr:hydroxyisourate hydrolase [Acidobacteriota bacterium]
MSAITTHVLDTSRGRPAPGVHVVLEHQQPGGEWIRAGDGHTDADGRLRNLLGDGGPRPGIYRLTFDTRRYFTALDVRTFYPSITVAFEVLESGGHYHVPLLLSPFGYSTYRGS